MYDLKEEGACLNYYHMMYSGEGHASITTNSTQLLPKKAALLARPTIWWAVGTKFSYRMTCLMEDMS